MLNLQYIEANRDIPERCVTSTARRGRKWFDQTKCGDEVALCITGQEDKPFGRAIIVFRELVTYEVVLENAEHNHVAKSKPVHDGLLTKREALEGALTACYGRDLQPDEPFTILHILPVNQ